MPGLKWGVVFMNCRYDYCSSFYLTPPEPPDSWERLEEDARKTPREYIEGRCVPVGKDGRVAAMARDLVRRAEALAGVTDSE